jgi:mRNA interferase RelE/StbE
LTRYRVYVTPDALAEIRNLPGHVRQRVKRAIRELADKPLPKGSRELDLPDFENNLCWLRLDNWRVIYAVTESENTVDVLAVRKRPPYDYGDLQDLLKSLD